MPAQKRTSQKQVSDLTGGILIDKPEDFFKKISAGLQKALGLRHMTTVRLQRGTREICYFRETSPVQIIVAGTSMPAIPLLVGGDQSVWVVVEVECQGGKPAVLQQISLKVHQGQTTETARICFRAEWDVRESTSGHAQPHWNVHAPGCELDEDEQSSSSFKVFAENREAEDSFASFITAQSPSTELDDGRQGSLARYGFTRQHMHRFHFAMVGNWHQPRGVHSQVLDGPQQAVDWIVGCASYVRHQFAFMLSLQ